MAMTGSLCIALAASAAGSKPYKWVDKAGVVHYGDMIPPEYADQAHQQLNQQGVPVRDFPRQLTPAEADAAQQSANEDARRRQHDAFLLNSYTKVSDIEQLRDERLLLIDGQMELARSSIATANQRLSTLQNRLRAFRPYSAAPNARRVPDQLAEEVVRALSDRRSVAAQLQQRESERAEQLASFEADIARYKALTSSTPRR
jgi:tRNA isopentenyl-2-thiomethyl-A-37 hydroxylase MiaE